MPKTETQLNAIKKNRRREIAIAGLKVFCEKGYDSATVDDIMKKANCSHGLFYHYFKSKKEIFDEVMNIKHEKSNLQLKEKVEKEPNHLEKIRIILENMFTQMKSDENFSYHYFFFLSRCFSYKEKNCPPPKKDKDKKPFIYVLENIFEQGQKCGTFTDKFTPLECANLLFAIIQGATLGYVIAPKDLQNKILEPNIDFILNIFKKGV